MLACFSAVEVEAGNIHGARQLSGQEAAGYGCTEHSPGIKTMNLINIGQHAWF